MFSLTGSFVVYIFLHPYGGVYVYVPGQSESDGGVCLYVPGQSESDGGVCLYVPGLSESDGGVFVCSRPE